MATFICAECRRTVANPYEQFTERLEYRRLDCQERRLSFALRDVCRDCVDAIRQRRSNPSGIEQPELFG